MVFLWELLFTNSFTDPNATQELFYTYGAIPSFVLAGDVLSILTSMFMHGGIAHIAGNMVFLFVFGDNVEDKFGHVRYLLIYFLWGIFSAYFHSLVALDNVDTLTPAVGASGAISGVLGAYLVMFPRAKILTVVFALFITTIRIPAIAFLPIWFIMQLVFGIVLPQSGGIAYFAHIGGFVSGLATAYIWKRVAIGWTSPISWPSASNDKIPFQFTKGQLVRAEPEIIKGSDFYEILAEFRGVTDPTDIRVDFDPHANTVSIGSRYSNDSRALVKLPHDASKYRLQYFDYLNGIVRVRLS